MSTLERLSTDQIYAALRVLAKEYIRTDRSNAVLAVLQDRQTDGAFPPGKFVLAELDQNRNGRLLTPEHQALFRDICDNCI